jgi:hypothetical protein
MKSTVAVVATILIALSAQAQVEITTFGQNGQLSWSAPSNSVCTIQWIPSLTTGTNWQQHWAYLDGLVQTSGTRTLDVPMFYRVVCWTNGWLQPLPVGRVTSFDVANKLSQTWAMTTAVHGILVPGDYRFVRSEEVYGGGQPEGFGGDSTDYTRSTDEACYSLQGPFETPIWRSGAVGFAWTNVILGSPGDRTNVCTIEAKENVVVPAGTFNCLKIHIVQSPAFNPIPEWYDWVSQGYGLVKRSNYNISNTNAAPVVYQLRAWKDR